ncbi:hypothetical protein [Streptomyces griseoflavus]|uniref:hypothetical protein n=1 Tax=Streptomyces griseoflavus TaxID=35619 RepID=UPI00131A22EA|nr:hypothetical protein [Streptomyces griseoflavus]
MSASDAQIADALSHVLESAPDHEVKFMDVYGVVRERLADTHGTDASVREVKRVLRAAGVRTRTTFIGAEYGPQLAIGVRLVSLSHLHLDARIRNALKP